MTERMKVFFVCRTTSLDPFSLLQPIPICTNMCQHSFVKNWGLDWVCASLLLIKMVWWGFVLSYEASVVLMHWKRTATESCICCVLMCIAKLVSSRQSTPTCNENICNVHLVAFFTGWNQGWLGGATHMPS
jgi:hypothetical protein